MSSFIVTAKYTKKTTKCSTYKPVDRNSAHPEIAVRPSWHPIIARAAKNKPANVAAVSKRDNIF
jgi:hypothetical protein